MGQKSSTEAYWVSENIRKRACSSAKYNDVCIQGMLLERERNRPLCIASDGFGGNLHVRIHNGFDS